MGLFIAVSSYFILYTINPNLVEFKNLRVRYLEKKELDTTKADLDVSNADITALDGETSPLGVPLFKQKNYSNVPYGLSAGGNVMIAGCGPTALAMILKYYNMDTDPGKLAELIMQNKNKYVGLNGTKHSVFTAEFLNQFGFKAEPLGNNINKIITHLKANHPVLASMGTPSIFTKLGHFVVLTAVNDNGTLFAVNDPNKNFYCTKEEINFPKYFPTYSKNLPKPPKDQQSFAAVCQQDGGQFIMPNAIPTAEITKALKYSWFISKI
ncbi:C39 family peptidase [Candidatus Peregrinibacteria bacterium]|nr:C39 family peptidase [Candidatus Peregrinibacteria bacterium]